MKAEAAAMLNTSRGMADSFGGATSVDDDTILCTVPRTAALCGIYKITNGVTGDTYIGSSSNIHARWCAHQRSLKKNTHHNRHLQHAWLKYGAASFSLAVLEQCPVDMLVSIEQRYMDAEQPTYNMAPIAGQGPGWKGKKRSPETIAKMKARVFTEECRAKMRASHQGYWTPAMRDRHRLSHLGQRPSAETLAKLRASLVGRPVSDETRRKIGVANAGKAHGPHTPETVAKMTAFQRARRAREKAEGKPISDAHRRHLNAMHAQNRGRRQPSIEIENRRAALKASFQRKRQAQPSGLLTTAEAATWLGVADGTVRRWLREGRLPARKTACGRMIAQSDLAAFLVQRPLFPD